MAKDRKLESPKIAPWVLAKIGDLKRNPKNPRIIKDSRFKDAVKSIKAFPEMLQLRPIVVNAEMMILGGDKRYLASVEAGLLEVPIIIADNLTEAQQQEFIIKDNVGFGEWDWELLAKDWDAVELGEWGLDHLEIEAKPTASEDGYVVPEGGVDTDIVIGDLFEIGPHRLLCGDSSNEDQLSKLMNGELADLLLTDPPYGIGIDGQKESKATNPKHNRKSHEFRGWDNDRPKVETFQSILSIAKKAIIWGGNYFADILPASRGWIYWSKGQDGLTMSDGELAWTSEDKPLRSVTVNRAVLQGSVHPTQKPTQVFSFCLDWAGNPELIADTYLGSGTTIVTAHQRGMKCYGMELDPKYCQVIIDRMIALDPSIEIKKNGEPYVKG